MCRTMRAVVINKPKHKNAIPYKRAKSKVRVDLTPEEVFVKTPEQVFITTPKGKY